MVDKLDLNSADQINVPLDQDTEEFLDSLFPAREIRRVLLVNPPDADSALFQIPTARRHRYTNYPPYGLALIAQHLRSIDVQVRVSNLNHEILKGCIESDGTAEFDYDAVWQSKLDQDIAAFRPDLIGITCMFTMTHTSFAQICKRAAGSGVPVAIGGVHITNDVERVLDEVPCADIAFLREGDRAVKDFVEVVNRRKSLEALGQVILNDRARGARQRYLGERVPTTEDIDVMPAFDLLDIGEYSDYGTIGAFYCFKPEGTRFATALSNRGCRAQCTFCSVRNFNGPGVRLRPVESVVDELEVLQNEHGIGHFMWLDDDLLRDHKRAVELFNEMVRRGLTMTWDATNGVIASSCTEEVIDAAAKSGCIALNIGMESGNRNILRQIKKPGTVETFLRAAEVLQKYEQIHSSVLLMLGFPGETMSMILDTVNVARQMDLDWYRISVLQSLPNTPIYDSMVAQGLIQEVGSSELRMMSGAYGKQAEIEQGLRLTSPNFEDAFHSIPLDAVPSADQLTDIWFYMNYHLNFHRLFGETRIVKIEQQFKYLGVLSDVISPENGFALYFTGYLQHKVYGKIEPAIVERLGERLATSAYWKDRMQAFGLSARDLETCDFKDRQIERILPGGAITTATASEVLASLESPGSKLG